MLNSDIVYASILYPGYIYFVYPWVPNPILSYTDDSYQIVDYRSRPGQAFVVEVYARISWSRDPAELNLAISEKYIQPHQRI